MLKLMEACSGIGELRHRGDNPCRVRYSLNRYQGVVEETGMPVPGWQRVEGSVEFADPCDPASLVGERLTLTLEDGRAIGVTLADTAGRILTEGHGPSRCSCC